MNTCKILDNNLPFYLGRKFTGNNYFELAEHVLKSKVEGLYFPAEEIAKQIQDYLLEKRKGTLVPFSSNKFVSSVKLLARKNATYSKSDYFNKDLTELYENAPDPMSVMLKDFEQKLVKIAFVDPDKGTVTIDNSSLNSNILEYKNELFETVFKYVSEKNPNFKLENFSPLYVGQRFNKESNYKQVMNAFGEILTKENYSPNVSIFNREDAKFLEIYNAGVLLSNFDELVEKKFRNIVSVNQENFNRLDNPINTLHYFIEFKGISTEFWKESSHEAESVEKYASNFVKAIAATIPLVDVNGKPVPNRSLGINGIYLIGSLIKNLKNDGTLPNFQSNPKGLLKLYLEKLLASGKISYNEHLESLHRYLYHPRKGVVDLIELKKGSNVNIYNKIVDIEAIIAHQLNNVAAPTYSIVNTNEPKKLLNLIERDFQGDELKKQIIDQILLNKNLYETVTVNKDIVTVETVVGPITVNDINIPNDFVISLLKELTGIDINNNFIKLLGNTQAGKKDTSNIVGKSFAALLTIGKKISKEAASKISKEELERFSKFLDETNVVNIITASIASLSPEANMTIKNTAGDNIPTIKQSNIAHEWDSVTELAKQEYGSFSNNLLFLKYPNLYKGTETQLEIVTEEKIYAPLNLNPEENFFLNFVENYVKPLYLSEDEVNSTGNYISFKLVNYSDKSTVLNQLIDQNLDIDGLGSLKSMKLVDLKTLNNKFVNSYYAHLINKIASNYEQLIYTDEKGQIHKFLPKLSTSKPREIINKINNFLEVHGKQLNSILVDTWNYIESQKKLGLIDKKTTLSFTEEVAYSKYKEGLRFNRVIENYYFSTLPIVNGIKSFTDLSEELFVKKLIEIAPNIPVNNLLGGTQSKKITKSKVEELYKNLNLELGDWVTFNKGSVGEFIYFTYDKVIDGKKYTEKVTNLSKIAEENFINLKINPLLAKWLHTQNLVRYNSLALTTKHEYQHPHKSKKSLTDMSIVEEITGRSISMTKRMVIHPATMEYFEQGLIGGIPKNIKLAVVNDLSSISYNFTGTSKEHDSWDGSLAANPFLTYMLKNSFPGKGISDVQKIIGTYAADTHSVFLKCALFTFTNEMIRKSVNSKINLDNLMKGMNNIDIEPEIDLSRDSINGNLIDFNQIVPDGVYFEIGKEAYKVERISKKEGNTYEVLLTNRNTLESISIEKTINNLYDLWQVVGGAYSKSLINGKLQYSNASVEVVGTIMSLVGDGVLKDKMIGILAQKSAVKNGATNINSSKQIELENPTLMYSTINSNFIGIQLDANHISDESVVNEISQVMSALAENQATPELYSELYRAVGQIINSEIESYKKQNTNIKTGQFDLQKISEAFVKVLKSGEQMGNAKEIISILEDISEKSIPISNNNFFKGFVINVISKLTSDFIKRKYPGIAAVLNPSHGMIQIFELPNGETVFSEDLLEMAEEGDIVNDLNLDINLRNKLIINNVINRLFPNPLLNKEDFGNIKPLDTIIIHNPSAKEEADKKQKISLIDINDYYRIKAMLNASEGVTVEVVKNAPRDLKPVEITYTQNGVTKNIFDNDPIRLTWVYRQALESFKETGVMPNSEDLDIIKNFINYFGKKQGINNIEIFNKIWQPYVFEKLKLWNKRSFELLDSNLNYEPVTLLTNFNDLFGNDDFTSKLDITVFNKTPLQPISNYVHKPAEIIMPKVYRTMFDIGHDSFAKINFQKEFYFKQKVSQLINPDTRDCDLFVANTNGDNYYISSLNKEALQNKIDSGDWTRANIITKDFDGIRWRVDIKGEKIYKLPFGAEVVLDSFGNEIIVFLSKNDVSPIKKINTFVRSLKGVFVYPFANNNKDLFFEYLEMAKKYSYANTSNIFSNLNTQEEAINYFDNIKEEISNNLSVMLYTSWQKSNDLIAARIPSQAMQSFMSMKTVGYNEDEGNNVYVSHWQIWLQGSDFDIDKAYIMMHGFKNGLYEGWSPYFDYSSYENLIKSEKIPVPNKIEYKIQEGDNSIDLSGDLIVLNSLGAPTLDFIITLLNKVKTYSLIKPSEDPNIQVLLDIINNHNTYEYSIASLKNFVVRNIEQTSNNPKNQISSYSPIDFGKYSDIKEQRENNFVLSLMDGISMDQQQETNAVGKEVIGIAANGIKDYFALVEYFSNYYKNNIITTDNEYFEREFNITGLGPTKVNRIAGLNLERKATEILNTYIGKQLGAELNVNSDPSLVLSSLLSASTDNAKELILKAINAGKEFASMHIYLIILGFDEGEVAKFMTSSDIVSLTDKFKSNVFVKQPKKSPDTIVKSIEDIHTKKEVTPKDIQLNEFKKIFSLSKELQFLAAILKINQGLKASPEVLFSYFQKIENEFASREKELIGQYAGKIIKDLKLPKDTDPYSIIEHIIVADKPYISDIKYIKSTLEKAKQFNLFNGGFSFKSYFADPLYKKASIDYYNLIKGTFNVLDIIEKVPHFKGMVEAAKLSYDNINSLSRKFKFVSEEVIQILKGSKINTVRYKIFGTNNVSLNEDQLNNAYNLFDDLVISKWFKSNFAARGYNINLSNIQELTKLPVMYYSENGSLNPLGIENINLNFSNDLDLFNFKLIMEKNLLPYLKKKFPDNKFLSGLVLRSKNIGGTERTWISTRVRMNKLMDPKNLELLFNYQRGFDELYKNNERLTIGDNEFKIADLFFLYNLIVNKDRFGSDRLTKLFRNYIQDINSIAKNFYSFYAKIDSGENELFDEAFQLNDDMRKIIEYGTLNTKGKLLLQKEKEQDGVLTDPVYLSLKNPNFTLVTAVTQNAPEYQKDNAYSELMKYINNNNLLIHFNCE